MRFVVTLALAFLLVTAQLVTVHTVLGHSQFSQTVGVFDSVSDVENCSPSDPYLPSDHVHNDFLVLPQTPVLTSLSYCVERLVWYGSAVKNNSRPLPVLAAVSSLPIWLATQRLLI